MSKIAFVTPWYGNIPGGAEAEARRTAEHLAQAGQTVEVLTTCILDFHADWGKNYHRAGTTIENGVTVRRFKVKKRNKAAFDAVNLRLMRGQRVSAEDEQTYINEMINCPDLYAYMRKHKSEYIFIFIPYMFATTWHGLQVAPERSILIPCLHDEVYAEMGIYRDVLTKAAVMACHVPAEKRLADKFFGTTRELSQPCEGSEPSQGFHTHTTQKRLIVGEGVDTDIHADAGKFRATTGIDGRFVLVVGRREPGKNTPLLLNYWTRFVQQYNPDLTLVLIGSGEVAQLPPQTIDLGFFPKDDVYGGMAAAECLIMPSVNESFSLVIMESWLSGRPVIVHADCAVTKEHVQVSNGGLYFADYDEFCETVGYVVEHGEMSKQMGELGKQYVLTNYEWDIVTQRYIDLLNRLS